MAAKQSSGYALRAKWCLLIVLLVACFRLIFLFRLPDSLLVTQIPDDAFYYLQAARNFARLGRWTFDGVEPSSGFHVLWGYLLALFYWVYPSASLHAVFLFGGVLQSIGLAVAALLVTRTAERLAGCSAWVGVLLVFLSAASLMQATWLMESGLVILSSAVVMFLLARLEADLKASTLTAMFLVGVLVSLCRSDAGLLIFWGLAAHVYLWRRGISGRGMVVVAGVMLAGALAGVGAIALHTHWISGEWVQASARQKVFWSQIAGRSSQPGLNTFYSFFNPLTNSFAPNFPSRLASGAPRAAGFGARVLWLCVMAVGLGWSVRSRHRPEMPAFAVAMILTVVSYCVFYRYNSVAVQGWYVENFEVPAALLAGLGLAWFQGRMPTVTTSAVTAMCFCGVVFSLKATSPWQEAMWRAGVFLRSHHEVRQVGAWNAGIIGYFADDGVAKDGVANMDGLMNDAILPYARRGDLARYFAERGIEYIFESPQIWERSMAMRGGYGDGVLQSCIVDARDLFPDDPLNVYGQGHIQLYRLDPECLRRSR